MKILMVPMFAALLLSTACGQTKVETVENPWVRLPAVAGRPAAAYFTLKGGAADARLLEISSPQALRVELHETKMDKGMMQMGPIEGGVAIAAGSSIAFAPGGKHAMLFDLNPKLEPGDTIKLVLRYADGHTLDVEAKARAASDTSEAAH